jgi:hypothetical protein
LLRDARGEQPGSKLSSIILGSLWVAVLLPAWRGGSCFR